MNDLNIDTFHILTSTPNVIISIRDYSIGFWQRFRTALPINFYATEVEKDGHKYYFCKIHYNTEIYLSSVELDSLINGIEQISQIEPDAPFQTEYRFNTQSGVRVSMIAKSWNIQLLTEEIRETPIEDFLKRLKEVRSKIESLR